jgi:N-methylhydantoinase B
MSPPTEILTNNLDNHKKSGKKPNMKPETDPIQLEVFKHRFAAIAEEMGAVLRKASYSPNIKERRDFSCALFNANGQMIAQAAHIPVHLGSMPLSVKAAISAYAEDLNPGDMIILNDPFKGGTHLPDITLVSPVFVESLGTTETPRLFGFVASRAHHADVGGMTPGSMPVAREIFQEGIIIPPIKFMESGLLKQEIFDFLMANVRTPSERSGDIWAQIAANKRGEQRLLEMVAQFGNEQVDIYMAELLVYTERMTRQLLQDLPDGEYTYTDFMDDDGISGKPVPIQAIITIHGDTAKVDFTGSAEQQAGSINAVYAITLSAVYYIFRCLLGLDIPNNDGCLAPIEVIAPEGTVVNAVHPAPVAGGNVETSQRIVDVLLGAISKAAPDQIPAASQGTMNNVTIGGSGENGTFAYYETIGGGMGALPDKNGPSGVHSHMTNTLNTPIEALEYAYPLRVLRYELRQGTGGRGQYNGGEGIRRDVQVLTDAQATLLTERRTRGPYGANGGGPGVPGKNIIIRDGKEIPIPGKGSFDLKSGDVLSIRTPGGGGYGKPNVG